MRTLNIYLSPNLKIGEMKTGEPSISETSVGKKFLRENFDFHIQVRGCVYNSKFAKNISLLTHYQKNRASNFSSFPLFFLKVINNKKRN